MLAVTFFRGYDGHGSIPLPKEEECVLLEAYRRQAEEGDYSSSVGMEDDERVDPVSSEVDAVWRSLRGTRPQEAASRFVDLLSECCPGWASWEGLRLLDRSFDSPQNLSSSELSVLVEEGERRAEFVEQQLARLVADRSGVDEDEARDLIRVLREGEEEEEESMDDSKPSPRTQALFNLWNSMGGLLADQDGAPFTPGSATVAEMQRLASRLRASISNASTMSPTPITPSRSEVHDITHTLAAAAAAIGGPFGKIIEGFARAFIALAHSPWGRIILFLLAMAITYIMLRISRRGRKPKI